MNLPNLTSADFLPLLPAIILVVGACVLLLSEVFLSATSSRGYQAVLSTATSVIAGIVSLSLLGEPAREVFLGFGAMDPFSSFLTFIVCVSLALASLTSAGFLRKRGAERGEFYALMLFAGAGMSLLGLSNELITLFVNIEVLSIATYALTSYLRRGTRPSDPERPVRIPGDPEWATREERRARGIPIPHALVARINEIASAAGAALLLERC